MIHTFGSQSIRRYGQKAGRPLAIADGEPQRSILNIDLVPAGVAHSQFMTLARYRSLSDRVPLGVEFEPSQFSFGKKGDKRRPRAFRPYLGKRYGFLFKPVGLDIPPSNLKTKLAELLDGALVKYFESDFQTMAEKLQLSLAQLDRYRYGALPRNVGEVRKVAKLLAEREAEWVQAWEEDALEAIHFLYPIPKKIPPSYRELTLLLRRATLYLGGLGPVQTALRNAGFGDLSYYQVWLEIYKGDYQRLGPRAETPFQQLADILNASLLVEEGITHPATTTLLLEEVQGAAAVQKGVEEIPVGLFEDVWAASAAYLAGRPLRGSQELFDPAGEEWREWETESLARLEAGEVLPPLAMPTTLPPQSFENFPVEGAVETFWHNGRIRLPTSPLVGIPPDHFLTGNQSQLGERTAQMLATLTPRRERLIRGRFGIGDFEEETLKEAGKAIGVGGARAQQIEAYAFMQLRHPFRSDFVRDFYEAEHPPSPWLNSTGAHFAAHRRVVTATFTVDTQSPHLPTFSRYDHGGVLLKGAKGEWGTDYKSTLAGKLGLPSRHQVLWKNLAQPQRQAQFLETLYRYKTESSRLFDEIERTQPDPETLSYEELLKITLALTDYGNILRGARNLVKRKWSNSITTLDDSIDQWRAIYTPYLQALLDRHYRI